MRHHELRLDDPAGPRLDPGPKRRRLQSAPADVAAELAERLAELREAMEDEGAGFGLVHMACAEGSPLRVLRAALDEEPGGERWRRRFEMAPRPASSKAVKPSAAPPGLPAGAGLGPLGCHGRVRAQARTPRALTPRRAGRLLTEDDELPLHLAAREGEAAAVAELLARHPEGAVAADKWGDLPLHNAARGGHAETVAALMRAYPEAAERSGRRCGVVQTLGQDGRPLCPAPPEGAGRSYAPASAAVSPSDATAGGTKGCA